MISKNNDLEKQLDVSKKAIHDILHETRNLNKIIKENAETISYKLTELHSSPITSSDINNLGAKNSSVFQASSLITMRLNMYALDQNPASIQRTTVMASIYGCFHKSYKLLSSLYTSATFQFTPYYSLAYFSDDFDLVAFLILENACKYSPIDTPIEIQFLTEYPATIIRIRSLGPLVSESDKSKILNKYYRGKYASAYSDKGNGIGLALCKYICDNHNFLFKVIPELNVVRIINEIPFAYFNVEITIPQTY